MRLPGLPLSADDASLRVRWERADGAEGALPVARDLRVALEAPAASRDRPPDEAELKQARVEEARLQARLGQVLGELKRLEELEPPERPAGARGEPPPESPVEARLSLVAFRGQRSEALALERSELEPALERARRRREELEARKQRSSDDRPPELHALRKTAVVRLDPPEGGRAAPRARLVVEYEVPGTRWAPTYTLRLDGDGGAAELSLSGVVAQRTGEDWSGVRLALSTADSRLHRELPRLASLRIGRRQRPRPPIGWREPPQGAEALYADWDRAFSGARSRARVEPEPPAPPPAAAAAMVAGGELDDEGEALSSAEATLELDEDLEIGSPPAAAAPPMAAALPAPTTRMRRTAGVHRAGRRPRPPVPEQPPGIAAREDLLEFAALRMPAPDDPDRGQLVVLRRARLYAEVEEAVAIPPAFVEEALRRSRRRAEEAGRSLPRGLLPADELEGEDAAFRAEAPVDVPSDDAAHAVPLLARTLPVELRHVCVPRESHDVYRLAAFTNPLPGPLLPGPIDVYSAGGFLLTAKLSPTPRGAGVELGLGVDPSVRASRHTRYREDARGLTGGRLQLDHEIEIEVRNNRPREVRLEVRERVPVAPEKHPDVQVELGEVSPAWEEWTPPARAGEGPLRGGYRWRLDVAGGEAARLKAAYRVRISAKHEIVGGNRRER